MIKPKEFLNTNRASLFDWTVMIISFMLGFVFPSLKDMIDSPYFFNWILASLAAYIIGAALKDLPLSRRMSSAAFNYPMVPYILFLLIGHWMIIMMLVILAEPAFRQLIGAAPLPENDPNMLPVFIWSMVTATVSTWLVYRTKSNRQKKRKYSATFLFWMELVADLLLMFGVSIFTFVFWEKGAMAMLGAAPNRTAGDFTFLFIFLGMIFLLFYLPLRYLFFIEDRVRGRNRQRLFIIFSLIMIRTLMEALGI